ncbi:sensor domain-containing diguanylate cyclase [bacterium]|nr:sensor domain-containing diguanylate cyclase [bacterium]
MDFSKRIIKITVISRWLMLAIAAMMFELSRIDWLKKPELFIPIIILSVYNLVARFIPYQTAYFRRAYAETTLDIVFITAIIFATGGMQSQFFLFYLLPIIFASCYYQPKTTLLVTIGIILLYIWLFISGEEKNILYLLGRMPIFLGIAGLVSFITNEIRLTQREAVEERERASVLQTELQERLNRVKEENKRLAEFYNVSTDLEEIGDFSSQLKKVLETVSSYLKCEINLITEIERGFHKVVAGDDIIKQNPDASLLIKENYAVLVQDIERDERESILPYKKMGISSLILLPLKIRENTIGAILSCSKAKREFSEEDQKFFRIIANISSLLIENRKLSFEIDRLSVTDKLTALFNFYYFEEALRKEIERSRRLNLGLSVIAVRLDTEEPEAGLLQKAGLIINYNTRREDLVANKENEFLILAYNVSKEKTRALSERIRERVKEETGSTVSCGIATLSRDIFTHKELIDKAEAALSEASKTRDTVIISTGVILKEV